MLLRRTQLSLCTAVKKNIKYYLLLNLIICWGLFNAYANLYLRFFDKILFGWWKKNLFFNDFTKQRPILAFNYSLWFFFCISSVKLGKNVMTPKRVIQSLKFGVNNCVIWLCISTCQRFSGQVFDFLIKKNTSEKQNCCSSIPFLSIDKS